MKRYIKVIAILVVGIMAANCQDLDKLNEDPNRVKDADPYLILPNVEKKVFSMYNMDKEYATRMIVQTDGENASQYFKWNTSGFGDYKTLMQVQKMMDEAKRTNKSEYLALGHFLKAQLFYKLTLTFGDIPFSEALLGEEEMKFPKYDTQESVFEGILKELETAYTLIEANKSVKGDIIYSGDLSKWKKLINSYQLKVLMSLSKKQTVGSINVAQRFNEVYQRGFLIDSNSDNGQITFFDVAGSRYPQFNSSNYGSGMYMSSTFINLMKDLQDPRLFVFAQQTATALEKGLAESDFAGYNGGNPIVPYAENEILVQTKNISKIKSRYYLDPTAETNALLSYAEMQFILAEASARGWIAGDTERFYLQGIKGNFEYYTQYAKEMSKYFTFDAYQAYVVQPKVAFKGGSMDTQLEQIMTQKYLIMFHQGDWTIYYDQLRTGYPKLVQQPGVTPPTRWMYPISEYNRNQANLQQAIDRQFADGDSTRGLTWWLK